MEPDWIALWGREWAVQAWYKWMLVAHADEISRLFRERLEAVN